MGHHGVRVAVATSLFALVAGCSSSGWEWKPGDDGVAPDVHHYYEYPGPDEFVLGERAAVVRFTALRRNQLVPESEGALAWVYTPAEVEIVEPGDTGLAVGSRLELAVPGGSAQGLSHAGLWVFDKAEIDRGSTYVVSWSEYDYPGFELGLVLDYLYEVRDDGKTLVRLQDEPGGESTRVALDVAGLLAEATETDLLESIAPGTGATSSRAG